MEPTDYIKYLILSLLVTSWCVLHSAMISVPVTQYLEKRLKERFRFYRLFFNLISIVTLIPVALFAYSIQTQAILQWKGYMRILQVLLLGIVVLLFYSGSRHYDARQLLGIRQIREGNSNKLISTEDELDTSGVLGISRHPWYLASILLIWARQMDVSAIIVNVILTSYLIVGTYLEEKKLIMEFGEKYLAYQKRVSMLIPFMWIKRKCTNENINRNF